MLTALFVYSFVGVVIMVCVLITYRSEIFTYIQKQLAETPFDMAVSQSTRYVIKHDQSEDWEEKFHRELNLPYERKPFSYDAFHGLTMALEGKTPKALPQPTALKAEIMPPSYDVRTNILNTMLNDDRTRGRERTTQQLIDQAARNASQAVAVNIPLNPSRKYTYRDGDEIIEMVM